MFLVLLATPSVAQTFPPFTGLVVDAANVIPPEREAALAARLEALQQQTGRQLVVATIADLQNYPIEDYGYKLGRAWGVGLKGADNGVILFVAPNEPAGRRGPRIEVGRRLEPIVTDALSSLIIRQQMMPLLRSGDVPGALDAGADALIAQLRLPDAQAQAVNAKAAAEFDAAHRRGTGGGGVPLGLIFWGLVAGFILLSALRRHSGGAGARRYQAQAGRDGSNWPIWLWAASELMSDSRRSGGGGWTDSGGWGGSSSGGGGSDGSWGGGGFTGGGGGDFGGGGASGDW